MKKERRFIACTFCPEEATQWADKHTTTWPTCTLHSVLENKYCVSTPNGKKISPGGIAFARRTGVDESVIMLYSQQSSTKYNEKSPRGRIGGTTKSESRHLAQGESYLPKGNSNGVQDVSGDTAAVQQPRREKVITRVGGASLREGEEEPY